MRAKLYNRKRFAEKAQMKKMIRLHAERDNLHAQEQPKEGEALPHYLLDRQNVARAKVLSNTIKQKRKEKAGRWQVPLPKVRPISEDEMFRVMKTGKRTKSFVYDFPLDEQLQRYILNVPQVRRHT